MKKELMTTKGETLKEKVVVVGKFATKVTLNYDGTFYYVYAGNDLIKKTSRELFAVQAFNEV